MTARSTDVAIAVGIVLVALAIFGYTLPRAITLEDAGLFQLVCHLGGIGHPPGYPLFTTLCQPLVALPLDPVVAGNLVSALAAAMACGCFYLVLRHYLDSLAAALASLGYAVSATFWSQAIIIEVYSLAVLMFVLTWWAQVHWLHKPSHPRLALAAFLYGLALCNHWPLMVLSTPALLLVCLEDWPALKAALTQPRAWVLVILAVSAGLMPYTLLLSADPPFAVYGPIDSVDAFVNYVSRRMYDDSHATATWLDKVRYAGWLIAESLRQFSWVLSPLVVLGAILAWRDLRPAPALALLALLAGTTVVLAFLIGFRYTDFYQAIFRPYPVIAYLAVAVWFGMGAAWACRRAPLPTGMLAALALAAVFIANLADNNRRDTALASTWGQVLLSSLPAGAVVFTNGDNQSGLLGFLHHVRGMRPDLELRDWENLVFANRLLSPFTPAEQQRAVQQAFIAASTRPVVSIDPRLSPATHHGLYYVSGGERDGVRFDPGIEQFLDYVLDRYEAGVLRDRHERHFAYHLLVAFTRQYAAAAADPAVVLDDAQVVRLTRLQATFPGRLVTLEVQFHRGLAAANRDVLLQVVAAAERDIPVEANPQSRAVFYEYAGRLHALDPVDATRAIAYFEASVAAWPAADNTSLCPLAALYEAAGRSPSALIATLLEQTSCSPS